MSSCIRIGTAESRRGSITYGVFDAVPLPTGGADGFPVIIAQGHNPGPTLWITGSIHGVEYDGLATIHQLITPGLPDQLQGTVVAIPTLNPAGLRTNERSPYYLRGRDPNRLFPASTDLGHATASRHPSALEMAYARLFEQIDATADYLIDIHNYGIASIPFAFRDPIFYREPADRTLAQRLQTQVGDMLRALGLTVVNEYVSDDYLRFNLHRSVSGAALNTARIPAVTLELGGQHTINHQHVRAAVSGIRNVMRWAGMLPGPYERLTGVPIVDMGYPVRRTTYPRASTAGVAYHLVQPGEHIRAGTPLARMVDIYGRPVGEHDGYLYAQEEGFVLGIFPGATVYPNDPIVGLAIRDNNHLVQPIIRRP